MQAVWQEYIERIPQQLRGTHIEFKEGGTGDWQVHKGDLIVNGDWPYNSHGLIVDGNVHITGAYDGCTHLVVMGDMHADHIIYWWGLTVVGNLTVPGMINIEHYLYPFEVGGTIQTRSLTIQHHNRSVHWEKLIANSFSTQYQGHNARSMLRDIKPALIAEHFYENASDSLDEMNLSPCYSESEKYIKEGQSPFRDEPLSDVVIEKIDNYLNDLNNKGDHEYDDDDLIADINLDPMMALTIAICVEECDLIRNELEKLQGQYGSAFDKILENFI